MGTGEVSPFLLLLLVFMVVVNFDCSPLIAPQQRRRRQPASRTVPTGMPAAHDLRSRTITKWISGARTHGTVEQCPRSWGGNAPRGSTRRVGKSASRESASPRVGESPSSLRAD